MVEISHCEEKCYGLWGDGNCSVIDGANQACCSPQCVFYKPRGCEDWIRRETETEIWLIPPEEYAPFVKGKSWLTK